MAFLFVLFSRVGWWRVGWNLTAPPLLNRGESRCHLEIFPSDWSRPMGINWKYLILIRDSKQNSHCYKNKTDGWMGWQWRSWGFTCTIQCCRWDLIRGSLSYSQTSISLWIFLLGVPDGESCWMVHRESSTYLSPLVTPICICEKKTSSQTSAWLVHLAAWWSLDGLIEPSSSI